MRTTCDDKCGQQAFIPFFLISLFLYNKDTLTRQNRISFSLRYILCPHTCPLIVGNYHNPFSAQTRFPAIIHAPYRLFIFIRHQLDSDSTPLLGTQTLNGLSSPVEPRRLIPTFICDHFDTPFAGKTLDGYNFFSEPCSPNPTLIWNHFMTNFNQFISNGQVFLLELRSPQSAGFCDHLDTPPLGRIAPVTHTPIYSRYD